MPPVNLNRKNLLSLVQYHNIVERKTSKSNQKIITKKSEANQSAIRKTLGVDENRISAKSDNNQSLTSEKSNDNPSAIKQKSNINQNLIQLTSERNHKTIIRLSKQKYTAIIIIINEFEKQTKPDNKKALEKLAACKNATEIAYENQDIQELDRVIKILLAFKNRREGIEKGRDFLRPELPLNEFVEKHKIVIELMTSDKFISKATKGYYKNFEAIKDFVVFPNEIAESIGVTLKERKIKDVYTAPMLHTIKLKHMEHKKQQNALRIRQLKRIGIAASALLIVFVCFKIFSPVRSTGDKVESDTSVHQKNESSKPINYISQTACDSLFKVKITDIKLKLSDWRKKHIREKIAKAITIQEAAILIDSLKELRIKN